MKAPELLVGEMIDEIPTLAWRSTVLEDTPVSLTNASKQRLPYLALIPARSAMLQLLKYPGATPIAALFQ